MSRWWRAYDGTGARNAPCWVYALIDPTNAEVFYIGISQWPNWRFREHSKDRCSAAWSELNRLLNLGYKEADILYCLRECDDRLSAFGLERELIIKAPGLLNRDNGRCRSPKTGRRFTICDLEEAA